MKNPEEEAQVEQAIAEEVAQATQYEEAHHVGKVALDIPDNIILGEE